MAGLLVAVTACAGLGGPRTSAGSTPGTTRYDVEGLSFEVPSSWTGSGGAREVTLRHPDEVAVLEVSAPQRRFASEKECLDAGREALARGDRNLQNLRRRHSSFGGRPAIGQEADQGSWHGWAWAVCDGGRQYRVFFSGRTPMRRDVVEAWRTLTSSAKVSGG